MIIHSFFATQILHDKAALGIDDTFYRQVIDTAHASVHDLAIAELLYWDLKGYRKYRFFHPKTREPCRYVFGYFPAPNMYKDDVVMPVWLSERRKMGPKYEQVKIRLGITPAS